MKTIFNKKTIKAILLALLASVGLFHSCEDKSENYLGELSPYIALEDVRALHKGSDVQLNEETLTGASKIYGTVISDHRSGNVPDGTIILQQWKRNRLRGMAIHAGSVAADFLPGDSIVVNINNKTLTRDGFLTVTGVTTADIEKISTGNNIMGVTTTAYSMNLAPQNFEGTLVKIVGGQMYPKPETGEVFNGTKLMINGADTVGIVTLPEAEFAQTQVPRNINVTGIMLGAKDSDITKNNIFPRYSEDIVDVSDPEVPEYIGSTPIIITGFCNDPSGGDSNYEYIQLRANTDINFAEVPFSVVTSNNAGSVLHTAGWATGGAKTYKFNLTEGSVSKGDIFYVGGHQKKINGANSTDISNAKWIRTIATANDPGDGLGDKNSNIMPNSGNAGGIAVFIGTNVAEQSVPVDVIFYGGNGTASIISPDKTHGYRIANTDHYAMYIQDTGELTPFFSMGDGKNDFRFPHHGGPTNTDAGYFFQLGGQFNTTTRKWETPREHNIFILDKSSTIDMIETGDGVTKQVD
ncbi:hypothetical protein G5B00_10350 [Parapedobacter sp. SGR-10]|uniref:DUF5689 domain-containing protein n=1 Tax=Parapedobacter sp. SGR-10 TaxID=2710879 RepID=UPI0013D62C8C|nr:DUF5689 domain-containing protein [Parapedobacter sp. SGR-10]NGF56914.1 hypothetical protein [Parapedobacter sp. SGR-10]